MLITIKNINAGKKTTNIIDPFAFFASGGDLGYEVEITNPKYEYITFEINTISNKYIKFYNDSIKRQFYALNERIKTFLQNNQDFLDNKQNYYTEFSIPKKKKDEQGRIRWRHLINPCPELKLLQKDIANVLQNQAFILPHNAAHAFRENRSYFTNAQYHKDSKHIINLDLKDFFDSITEDILYTNLKLHPVFNIDTLGEELLQNIIKIATYKGTTPQGSPLSPFLSNIIMVNFDFRLRKLLSEQEIATLYTRYADDMTFSSKKSQDITHIIHLVEEILKDYYDDKIKINYNKTKKITPGRCFITGVKLNQKHNLTVGWEKKKLIKSKIYNLGKLIIQKPETDYTHECQSVLGYLAFMYNIEPDYTSYLFRKYTEQLTTIRTYLSDTPIEDMDLYIEDLVE